MAAQFYQNIPCGSRFMSIFTDHDQLDWCSPKSCSSKNAVTPISTNWLQPAEMTLSNHSYIKKCCYTVQWFENVGMHLYAKFDQNIPCCSKVMSIFTYWPQTGALTNGFLLGTFYVRKSSQESVSTQKISENFNGINHIFSLLAPFICKWGLLRNWFLEF